MDGLMDWFPLVGIVVALGFSSWALYQFVVHFYELATKEKAFVRTLS